MVRGVRARAASILADRIGRVVLEPFVEGRASVDSSKLGVASGSPLRINMSATAENVDSEPRNQTDVARETAEPDNRP